MQTVRVNLVLPDGRLTMKKLDKTRSRFLAYTAIYSQSNKQ